MPSPERPSGAAPERQPVPYHRAARFAAEQPARDAYFASQGAVLGYKGQVDLSTYRVQIDAIYHVVVLGEEPPAELGAQIDAILAAGEGATVHPTVLTRLAQRRREQSRHGPSIARHHRPGKRLP
jgi:hypothetical protein